MNTKSSKNQPNGASGKNPKKNNFLKGGMDYNGDPYNLDGSDDEIDEDDDGDDEGDDDDDEGDDDEEIDDDDDDEDDTNLDKAEAVEDDDSEDEGIADYKISGYHPIYIGEVLQERYVVI
mmetsp:Transcript_6023/g.5356  ORF Transcript_6023/g.5356 Transcript_6023/m.5356 type:complete len:120 (-) Transcript_6023:1461-1820(-)|eukprot:CAMPEP_0114595452 /NCGR_PEP_ID=MMETSP0125-20121206/17246_1 /TAXON_ID=485358 ORGANISM="Aristerostoma sp., Strain ATCC 50986" /NCGR_SAMPLE_ID=MMETSP0125 /ASSEMBLY_ACC=CAM_ASM_000245 /LENGTH=119 /DNA_ID=CAMNT_0001797045 /DNA_START=97 /DNA_END=456 /DNA_ORIENTATION=+